VSAGTGFDPVRQSQLLTRSVLGLLRRRGAGRDGSNVTLSEDARARRFDQGEKQLAGLAAEIEAHTGVGLSGRRALDYGCGFGRLAIPLAERSEYVYGLDILPEVLKKGAELARERGVQNIEWMEAGRLEELAGRYDLVISHWVFQHIPTREGERIFAAILRGLQPGGVGAVHFSTRPEHPVRELLRDPSPGYAYNIMNAYSLNRLARLLAEAGVGKWLVRWHTSAAQQHEARQPLPSVTLIFRKGAET
jgi:2-polyprenyl-3-methyl-5-hydroxy-6-metoxy-1,4-benzoquinol methylase